MQIIAAPLIELCESQFRLSAVAMATSCSSPCFQLKCHKLSQESVLRYRGQVILFQVYFMKLVRIYLAQLGLEAHRSFSRFKKKITFLSLFLTTTTTKVTQAYLIAKGPASLNPHVGNPHLYEWSRQGRLGLF